MSALAAAICLTGVSAEAQRKPKKPAAAAQPPAQPAPVDADAPDQPLQKQMKEQVQQEQQQQQEKQRANKPAKVVDNSPPATAGQPTEAANQAKRLYESEKWWDAAKALYRVSTGETGDDEGNKQIAQFNLAKALYKLKFFQGAYSIFSEITDKPNHLKYNETLLWLAKLATDLPEPADIIERVGKYNEEHVAKFNNHEQQELYWQLNYLLGRYRYRNGEELFGPVAVVYKVSTDDEAVQLANVVDFGLGGAVWSTDEERAIKVAEQLEVGMANVNTPAGEGADLPFGGTKRSGFGRELGPLGIDEFVNKRLFYVEK